MKKLILVGIFAVSLMSFNSSSSTSVEVTNDDESFCRLERCVKTIGDWFVKEVCECINKN